MAPAATTTATATATATGELSRKLLSKAPPFDTPTFSFTPFLQRTYLHSLPADRPLCKAYINGHCPLGTRCPERHVSVPNSGGKQDGGHPFNSLVCKHWLRGLCKKGESCEFLHEFNLRKMPECNFFLRNGFCSNGDECLYLHIDPQSKLPPCPHYEQGFCPLGPRCAKKHARKKMCPYYLAGFCPDGPDCTEGAHPKWKTGLEKPSVKVDKKGDEEPFPAKREHADDDDEGSVREFGDRHRDRDRERDRDNRDRDRAFERGGHQGRFGGRGGKWRGRGRGRGRH